jgi:electron transfer flavoprotein beta subunit
MSGVPDTSRPAGASGDGRDEIAVCLKWVDHRPELEPVAAGGAHVRTDTRSAGASEADRAALEWALRAGEATGRRVVAVAAGPPAADDLLREAVAVGAGRAVRVDLRLSAPSPVVAEALAGVLAGCTQVWCGDHSLDRGSGTVPAYLAAELGLPQALGLLEVDLAGLTGNGSTAGGLVALRRLDGGRRERLRLPGGRAVLSVEGGTAKLRRAPLGAALRTRAAEVRVVPGPPLPAAHEPLYHPYRPRPRTLNPPPGDTARARVVALTGAGAAPAASRAEVVEAPPAEAAARILAALDAWGYGRPG